MTSFLIAIGITAALFGLFALLAIMLARSAAANQELINSSIKASTYTYNTITPMVSPEEFVPVSNPPHGKTDSL